VVKKVRNLIKQAASLKKIKVGHAGTLDPLATGLLILCTGRHTKQIESLQGLEKGYEMVFKLGATTPSYDSEFPEENICDTSHLTEEQIKSAMATFEGEIDQVPPIFSAIKIQGKRAFKSARKGQEVKLVPRPVHIYEFQLLEYRSPEWIRARVRCSKGTYIRALARDLGEKLGVGGYLLELTRTFIGPYRLEDAWEIEDFAAKLKGEP
jgi:tRNA pseudouridine55 synthase